MVQPPHTLHTEIVYPDCDGEPMANHTEQFDWIVMIKENLDILSGNEDVFVAGDLFWYPIEGNNEVKVAPDVLVALGRPKGKRHSYKQWEEGHQPPQVVFEIISLSNTQREMDRKLLFFNTYGVEEYYIYDPSCNELRVWIRQEHGLDWVEHDGDWTSPRLNIRMDTMGETLKLFGPDGKIFLSPKELAAWAEQEKQRAETAERQLETAKQRLLDMGLTAEQVAAALGETPVIP